jgi:hypothetical protein
MHKALSVENAILDLVVEATYPVLDGGSSTVLLELIPPVGTVCMKLGGDHEPQRLRLGSRGNGDRSSCVGLQQFS